MRNWLVFITICVALGLATGCPRGQKVDEPSATSDAGTATADSSAGVPDGTVADNGAATGQTGSSTAATTPAENEDPALASSKLAGEWLALFGRHDTGVVEDAYTTGQRVKFDKQGQVVFTLVISGKPTTTSGSYTAAGGVATLKLPAAQAVKSGLSQAAPLGISRNDEVGLLRQADRNEEIGLANKSGAPDAQGNIMRDVKFAVYGDFLVLADSVDHLMVYGKYADQEPAVPDLSGKWEAKFGSGAGIPATASGNGKLLTIDLGAQGAFSGSLVRGFAVGQIKGPQGLSLVGLFPVAPDKLQGVYLPDPYLELKTDLELTRYVE